MTEGASRKLEPDSRPSPEDPQLLWLLQYGSGQGGNIQRIAYAKTNDVTPNPRPPSAKVANALMHPTHAGTTMFTSLERECHQREQEKGSSWTGGTASRVRSDRHAARGGGIERGRGPAHLAARAGPPNQRSRIQAPQGTRGQAATKVQVTGRLNPPREPNHG